MRILDQSISKKFTMSVRPLVRSLQCIITPIWFLLACTPLEFGSTPQAECLIDGDCAAGLKCRRDTNRCETPQDELCDEVDNDLDGETDEGLLNACGTCGDVPEETCAEGDNDCDGLVDEGFERLGDSCEPPVDEGDEPERLSSIWVCIESVFRCVPTGDPLPEEERCDGVDNDLDEEIDESITFEEAECPEGSCRGSVLPRCEAGEVVLDCDVPLGESDLTCDGIDDDCDLEIDEDFLSESMSCAEECLFIGETQCVGGEVIDTCDLLRQENIETCDGIDNDCDSAIDEALEDWVDTETPCAEGACQTTLKVSCQSGQEQQRCAVDPSIDPILDPLNPENARYSPDLCDGVDADCDGRIDESSVPEAFACESGAMFNQGLTRCLDGVRGPTGCDEEVSFCALLDEDSNQCECDVLDAPDDEAEDRNCDGIDGDIQLALFVSAEFGDDERATGQQISPFQTINAAIDRALTLQIDHPTERAREIYIAQGAYPFTPMTLDQGAVHLYGGYTVSRSDELGELVWGRVTVATRQEQISLTGEGMTQLNVVDPNPAFSIFGAQVEFTLEGLHIVLTGCTIGPCGCA